jgi:hypothetical protein
MDFQTIGRFLVVGGIVLVILGGLFMLFGRTGFLGNLPGDIRWESGNFSCFVPIGTMIVISLILTVVLNIIIRIINR